MGKLLFERWQGVSHWQRGLMIGLAVVASGLLYVSLLRLFADPRPVGVLQQTIELDLIEIGSHSQEEAWLEPMIPAADYSVLLTAAHGGGETDVRYGIALGEPNNFIEISLSPLGYAAVHERVQGHPRTIRPVAPFPHVRGGAEPNEIWLTVENGELVVRLNREIFWVGEMSIQRPRIRLTAETFGEPTHIEFQQVRLYYDNGSP